MIETKILKASRNGTYQRVLIGKYEPLAVAATPV